MCRPDPPTRFWVRGCGTLAARRTSLGGAERCTGRALTISCAGVTEAFKANKNPLKMNLGVGAYRDGEGKPYVLPSVRIVSNLEICPALTGNTGGRLDPLAELRQGVPPHHRPRRVHQAGRHPSVRQGLCSLEGGTSTSPARLSQAVPNVVQISITQSISGTGGLRIGAAFLARFYPHSKAIYLPGPTWGNHIPVMKDSGLEVKTYTYYDKKTFGLDFEGMKKSLRDAPNKSIFLLHACAHNPTGVDPSQEQWQEIVQIFKVRPIPRVRYRCADVSPCAGEGALSLP